MAGSLVSHEGVVKSVSGDTVTVEILCKSMCSGCHARSVCSASDMVQKDIQVRCSDASRYSAGERVRVVTSLSSGYLAVLVSYIFPLVILIVLLLYLQSVHVGEGLSALVSLGAVAVYFLFVYVFRKRIGGRVSFYIEKIGKTDL